MVNPLNSLQNNHLAQLTQNAPKGVMQAIQTASTKTGVNFTYLVEKAAAESNFDASAKAKTSSATGLFQFIESTWMDMIDRHGAKHGISPDQDRQTLLNLRKDPKIASLMAAEFAEGNKAHLEKTVGGNIGNTEMYFAHFMGAGGASAFLNQLKENPLAVGADLFPAEARANRNVFYDRDAGKPKSLQEIYSFFDKKFDSNGTKTLAHKPTDDAGAIRKGYQHITPSLKQPTEIIAMQKYNAMNSLYQLESQLDAFFSTPTQSFSGAFPTSLYGNLSSESALLLSLFND